jgi:hypothetical protein
MGGIFWVQAVNSTTVSDIKVFLTVNNPFFPCRLFSLLKLWD